MRIKLENSANYTRTGWASVTCPTKALAALQHDSDEYSLSLDGGGMWRAVKGHTVGDAYTVVHIHCTLGPREAVFGDLYPMVHPEEGKQPFAAHPWIVDNLEAMQVRMHVVREGVLHDANIRNLREVKDESNVAMRRYVYDFTVGSTGVAGTTFVDLYSGDPVARYWTVYSWGDPDDPSPETTLNLVGMFCGEPLSVNLAVREGYEPVDLRAVSLGGPVTLRDGAGAIVSGRIISTPEGGFPTWNLTDEETDPLARVIESGLAAYYGDIEGVCLEWNGEWTASIVTGEASATAAQVCDRERIIWSSMREQRGEDSLFGMTKTPSGTGDQEDFGVTRGMHATELGMVSMLEAYRHAAYVDARRGYLKRELDGSLLDIANHPEWTTWSGETHYHPGISRDRLGKEDASTFGWAAYDRQHWSQNTFAAYLTLCDDPAARMLLGAIKTTAFADVRYKHRQISAARAEGRTIGTFAHFSRFDPEFRTLIRSIADNQGRNPKMAQGRAMRVLNSHGPDGRKRIYDENGSLLASASMWEHGLAACGWALATNVDEYFVVHDVFRVILETLATWGCFEENGQWYVVDDIAYFDGAGPPIVTARVPERTPDGTMDGPRYTIAHGPGAGGGTWNWTLYGLEVASYRLPAGELRDKAAACVRARLPQTPVSRRDSEWRALKT